MGKMGKVTVQIMAYSAFSQGLSLGPCTLWWVNNIESMTGLRQQMQYFIHECGKDCERLLGFAHQNGGLTDEECQALLRYAHKLTTHISNLWEAPAHLPSRIGQREDNPQAALLRLWLFSLVGKAMRYIRPA
jgi:hypothetical protein